MNTKFEIGQIVWLKINSEFKGTVTGIILRPNNCISYFITWNTTEEMLHYEIELIGEKPTEFED